MRMRVVLSLATVAVPMCSSTCSVLVALAAHEGLPRCESWPDDEAQTGAALRDVPEPSVIALATALARASSIEPRRPGRAASGLAPAWIVPRRGARAGFALPAFAGSEATAAWMVPRRGARRGIALPAFAGKACSLGVLDESPIDSCSSLSTMESRVEDRASHC